MGKLGIDTDPRSVIYKRVTKQLKTDPNIGGRFTWRCWDGDDKDNGPQTTGRPAIVMYPQFATTQMTSADAWSTDLDMEVRIYLGNDGDATVYFDVWGAIERALYRKDNRDHQLKFQQDLRDAGAETGLVKFSRPAQIVSGDGPNNQPAVLYAAGTLTVVCLRPINP